MSAGSRKKREKVGECVDLEREVMVLGERPSEAEDDVRRVDGAKRLKMGSPLVPGDLSTLESSAFITVDEDGSADRVRRKKKKRATEVVGEGSRKGEAKVGAASVSSGMGVVGEMKAISMALMGDIIRKDVGAELVATVSGYAHRYEEVLFKVMLENERLRGKLDVLSSSVSPRVTAAAVSAVSSRLAAAVPSVALPPPVAASALPAAPAPVDTYALVVKGEEGSTSKEVIRKIEKEVGPSLGVRVHEMRPLKSGGAVIRTRSKAERAKVAANAKFKEVGLTVEVNDRIGPKVVVQRVHSEISPDEFMSELYEMNLKEKIDKDSFKKNVRLVSKPWKAGDRATDVVLEGSAQAMGFLLGIGRIYVKWFSFGVRPYDVVPGCYRCLGFDHRVRDCRLSQDVCRRCGQVGHKEPTCVHEVRCRNCAFKGYPSGHRMMSAACPIYASLVAKVNSRH